MKKFFSFKRNNSTNINTAFARARMNRSIPGEAAAMASIRLGGMCL